MRVSWQVGSQESIKVVSQDGESEVEVNLDNHRRGNAVEVEEIGVFSDFLFHEPASSVFSDQVLQRDIEIVGDDESGFNSAVTGDGDLAEFLAIIPQEDFLIIDRKRSAFSMSGRHPNGFPMRGNISIS